MSIANELHWTTAAKPKFGKSTEHSGAKQGKGAWNTKKVAKKGSNKGRRAADKKTAQDTTGDESDGPFPGAAPLFKKAAAMHWTTAEPRPCYPTEEPVEDHCNDGIAPPAPGGGDDMGSAPPTGFSEQEEGPVDWDSYEGYDEPNAEPQEMSDYEIERQGVEREWEEQDEIRDVEDDFLEVGEDPQAPQGPGGQQMTGPHGARDPSLAPDAPHQFWAQEAPHIQDALNKYLIPQLQNPNPEIAKKAQRILMEGPHAE